MSSIERSAAETCSWELLGLNLVWVTCNVMHLQNMHNGSGVCTAFVSFSMQAQREPHRSIQPIVSNVTGGQFYRPAGTQGDRFSMGCAQALL